MRAALVGGGRTVPQEFDFSNPALDLVDESVADHRLDERRARHGHRGRRGEDVHVHEDDRPVHDRPVRLADGRTTRPTTRPWTRQRPAAPAPRSPSRSPARRRPRSARCRRSSGGSSAWSARTTSRRCCRSRSARRAARRASAVTSTRQAMIDRRQGVHVRQRRRPPRHRAAGGEAERGDAVATAPRSPRRWRRPTPYSRRTARRVSLTDAREESGQVLDDQLEAYNNKCMTDHGTATTTDARSTGTSRTTTGTSGTGRSSTRTTTRPHPTRGYAEAPPRAGLRPVAAGGRPRKLGPMAARELRVTLCPVNTAGVPWTNYPGAAAARRRRAARRLRAVPAPPRGRLVARGGPSSSSLLGRQAKQWRRVRAAAAPHRRLPLLLRVDARTEVRAVRTPACVSSEGGGHALPRLRYPRQAARGAGLGPARRTPRWWVATTRSAGCRTRR